LFIQKLITMRKNLLLLFALLAIQFAAISQTITSAQTGNWTATTTWVGGIVPGSANDVVIDATHTVTLNTTPVTINSLTVNAGGTLTIPIFNQLYINLDATNNGTINIGNNSGLRMNGSLFNNSSIAGVVNSILIVGGSQVQNTGTLQCSTLYFATNTAGTSTFELRIFASTLSLPTLTGTLGFVASTVDYTRSLTTQDIAQRDGWLWGSYVDFLRQRSDTYAPTLNLLESTCAC